MHDLLSKWLRGGAGTRRLGDSATTRRLGDPATRGARDLVAQNGPLGTLAQDRFLIKICILLSKWLRGSAGTRQLGDNSAIRRPGDGEGVQKTS